MKLSFVLRKKPFLTIFHLNLTKQSQFWVLHYKMVLFIEIKSETFCSRNVGLKPLKNNLGKHIEKTK